MQNRAGSQRRTQAPPPEINGSLYGSGILETPGSGLIFFRGTRGGQTSGFLRLPHPFKMAASLRKRPLPGSQGPNASERDRASRTTGRVCEESSAPAAAARREGSSALIHFCATFSRACAGMWLFFLRPDKQAQVFWCLHRWRDTPRSSECSLYTQKPDLEASYVSLAYFFKG